MMDQSSSHAGSTAKGGSGGASAGTAGSSTMGGSSTTGGDGGQSGLVEPTKLSETGLFTDIKAETLSDGVKEYAPAYQLWRTLRANAVGFTCRREAPSTARKMDYWKYPVGTKFWKEFTSDDVRVETRMIQKVSDSEWFMMAFEWNDDQSDADRRP